MHDDKEDYRLYQPIHHPGSSEEWEQAVFERIINSQADQPLVRVTIPEGLCAGGFQVWEAFSGGFEWDETGTRFFFSDWRRADSRPDESTVRQGCSEGSGEHQLCQDRRQGEDRLG